MFKIATFAEGAFEDIRVQPTLAEARAWASGFTSGACKYGAGGVGAYVLPEGEAEMKEQEEPSEVESALAEAALVE